jgi:hypothetical protein
MSRPEFFLVAFVGLWIGISFIVSRIGGWATLATFYRLSGSLNGECWQFQSGGLRWKMGYKNCLTVGVNPARLYLSVFFLFRFGHPNLFIPWAEISATLSKRDFLSIYTEFKFRQAPMIPFRVNERLAQRIIESAGSSWPGKDRANKGDLERREG